MVIDPWLVVPCIRSRVHELDALTAALQHPADRTVVVTTTRDPIDPATRREHVLVLTWTGWHISRWWNAGMDLVETLARGGRWEVMISSSDVTGAPNAVNYLATRLRELGVTMIGPDWHNIAFGDVLVMRANDHRDLRHRVPGACWMLAGEAKLRCDEAYRWWYTDDDLEMQARRHGGVAVVSGSGLGPDRADFMDLDKYNAALEDRELYVRKWGRQPW